MRLIFWLNGWLVRILCVLAVAVVAAMALGISAEVILRVFAFPSITGLIELTEYGLFMSTFFVAPYLLRTNEHIRVDIVMSRVDPAAARIVEYVVFGLIIFVSAVTGFVGSTIFVDSIRDGTLIFKDLVIPQWSLGWVIPITSLAMGIQALEMMVTHHGSLRPVDHEASGHVPGIRPEEMP
jgi:TRAP-type C4-dicarboxylate transport system permease small subunit